MRGSKKNISVKNLKGFVFLEVLIASILGIFVLIAAFYAIGNILSNAVLTEKKVELANELESRVDNYMLTGNFDDSSFGDLTFSRVDSGSGIREFVGTNSSFSLQIIKRAYAPITVAEVMSQQLGAYMHRANELYIEHNASMIDETPELVADINVARGLLDSKVTDKWSSNTAVLLNLGTSAVTVTQPLDNPPLDIAGAYVTIAPFTNADITPSILWHCTAFGFDADLLPSWCVL
ncbi:type II secretion system protein [Francisella philomiragia]|uniref:type II secretion system protein n=1 Tax=Francisella philomiragia TaxID=28110 RepID=UPI003516934F